MKIADIKIGETYAVSASPQWNTGRGVKKATVVSLDARKGMTSGIGIEFEGRDFSGNPRTYTQVVLPSHVRTEWKVYEVAKANFDENVKKQREAQARHEQHVQDTVAQYVEAFRGTPFEVSKWDVDYRYGLGNVKVTVDAKTLLDLLAGDDA